MKILHVISALDIGGAQRLLSDILPIMSQTADVGLLVYYEAESNFTHKIEAAYIRIEILGSPNVYNPLNILRIAKHIRQYDIVHVHLFPSLYWVALANMLCHRKLVYTEHNTYNKRRNKWYFRPIERWIYSRYSKIISISELTQKNLTDWLRPNTVERNKFVVVNNGVNIKAFSGICKNKVYPFALIMIARFAPAKDQATIIRALALLPDDIHMILVGDGEGLTECKKVAASYGLDSRVHFAGSQSDVAKWISMADVGVQSSLWEGFGLTAVEMMAAGLPVVASDVDGLRQVVSGAGLLFPVGNEKALAEHIERLRTDHAFCREIAEKCSERAKEYDIHRMADEYMRIYEELI